MSHLEFMPTANVIVPSSIESAATTKSANEKRVDSSIFGRKPENEDAGLDRVNVYSTIPQNFVHLQSTVNENHAKQMMLRQVPNVVVKDTKLDYLDSWQHSMDPTVNTIYELEKQKNTEVKSLLEKQTASIVGVANQHLITKDQALDDLKFELNKSNAKVQEFQKLLKAREGQVADLKLQLEDALEQKVVALQGQSCANTHTSQVAEEHITILNSEKDALKGQIKNLETKLSQMERELLLKDDEIHNMHVECFERDQASKNTERSCKQLEFEMNILEMKLKEANHSKYNLQAELYGKINKEELKHDSCLKDLKIKIDEESQKKDGQIHSLKEEVQNCKDKISELEEQAHTLHLAMVAKDQCVVDLRNTIVQLEAQMVCNDQSNVVALQKECEDKLRERLRNEMVANSKLEQDAARLRQIEADNRRMHDEIQEYRSVISQLTNQVVQLMRQEVAERPERPHSADQKIQDVANTIERRNLINSVGRQTANIPKQYEQKIVGNNPTFSAPPPVATKPQSPLSFTHIRPPSPIQSSQRPCYVQYAQNVQHFPHEPVIHRYASPLQNRPPPTHPILPQAIPIPQKDCLVVGPPMVQSHPKLHDCSRYVAYPNDLIDARVAELVVGHNGAELPPIKRIDEGLYKVGNSFAAVSLKNNELVVQVGDKLVDFKQFWYSLAAYSDGEMVNRNNKASYPKKCCN